MKFCQFKLGVVAPHSPPPRGPALIIPALPFLFLSFFFFSRCKMVKDTEGGRKIAPLTRTPQCCCGCCCVVWWRWLSEEFSQAPRTFVLLFNSFRIFVFCQTCGWQGGKAIVLLLSSVKYEMNSLVLLLSWRMCRCSHSGSPHIVHCCSTRPEDLVLENHEIPLQCMNCGR